MQQKQNLLQIINSTQAASIATIPEVASRFEKLYMTMQGGKSDIAKAYYEAEKYHFIKIIKDNPGLQQCTHLSLYGVFLDMAVYGLSFDPSMKHAYVVPKSINVGTKAAPKYEKRATLMIDGRGELVMRQRQGQVLHVDNPVLVYEGDQFSYGTKNEKTFLEHMATLPRTSDNIIACYLKITRTDGSIDFKMMSREELEALRKRSDNPNGPAWSSLAGMFANKTIKHAFRTYPKIRVMGKFTEVANHADDEGSTNIEVDYGLSDNELPEATGTCTPVMIVQPVKETAQKQADDDDFSQPNNQPETKADDDDF